ncbi:MAG: hypothetical protein Fur0026_06730 [Sideroxydans sp.]
MPKSISAVRLVALLLILPGLAQAEGYAALSYGSGPEGYRSYSFTGDVDLSRSVKLSLDHFLAQTTGASNTRQTGAGLSWQALELVAANYRFSETNDGTFAVKGNEGGLSFALDTLWQGELQTSLDLGYGSFKYKAANPQSIAASNFVLTQDRSSVGLSQDLTTSLTLYGSHDQYKYDRNVKGLAIFLLKRSRNTSKAAFSLLAFPDKTNTLGLGWRATDDLKLDLSSGKTTTLLDQQLKNTRLGIDYQVGDRLNLGGAVTRSTASAMVNNLGVTVQPETRDNYWELTAGWSF